MIIEDKIMLQDKWGRIWEWRGETLYLEADAPADFVKAPGVGETPPRVDSRSGASRKLGTEEIAEMQRLEVAGREQARVGPGYSFAEGKPRKGSAGHYCEEINNGMPCIWEKRHLGLHHSADEPWQELSIRGYDPYHPERSTLAYKMAKQTQQTETQQRGMARQQRDEAIIADLRTGQHSLQTAAEKHKLGRERVRQIAKEHLTPEEFQRVRELGLQ